MNVAKSLKQCARAMRQRGWRRIPQDIQVGCVGLDQRRNYQDDSHDWSSKRGEDAGVQMKNVYGEDRRFDPRYDDRHYKSYYRGENYDMVDGSTKSVPSSPKDPESRRRITQDTMDHQRRQERIIQENKIRWQQRSEPKTPVSQYTHHTFFSAENPRKPSKQESEDQTAEEYSRRRRQQRLKEAKEQERELRESRKGYKIPKSEDEQGPPENLDTRYASEAWLEKRDQEDEAQYWHTWTTCPEERRGKEMAKHEAAEDEEDEGAPKYNPSERRGFVKPTLPYDSSVRRFQTHSLQLAENDVPPMEPPQHAAKDQGQPKRRRPSGMEKQFLLARDFNRLNFVKDDTTNRPSSLLQSHVFNLPRTVYAEEKRREELKDIELPEQPPRRKLAWQGLPRPVYKRFDGVNRAIARNDQVQRKKCRKCVEPPRFRMTVKSKTLSRKPTPIDSFSSLLAVSTNYTPHSEYTGYGRQTVCDAWQNFTNVHNLKPIY
ncbi:uncharacterized protein DDB_G0290301 [Drosophila virilis]|uniref:Uncharacterized protein n=1 Tax=Drosophila virilis TaxID=7244 RepID=B4LPA4_DROVI|nr:uncharacterized protein LOC6625726 [Drosophila virilis]EDW60213.1 uncharacterized protein Dvir_GJ20992 [Drosophila virilis]